MTLKELADKEEILFKQVIDLYNIRHNNNQLKEIFIEYKNIHLAYSMLPNDIEALKRGLFIQWYSKIEPNYLTGVDILDEKAELAIIITLEMMLKSELADSELIWMINYYNGWSWFFRSYKSFIDFDENTIAKNNQLPNKISKEEMHGRGQMGEYFNSLSIHN